MSQDLPVPLPPLMPPTEDEMNWLTDNPNTLDIVDFIKGYATHYARACMAPLQERADALQAEVQRTWFVIKDAGHHPGRTDDLLADVVRSSIGSERERAERAEAELKTRNKSPKDRLHNICQALSEEREGSPFSREEWDRIDAENLALRKRADALEAALSHFAAIDLKRADVPANFAWHVLNARSLINPTGGESS